MEVSNFLQKFQITSPIYQPFLCIFFLLLCYSPLSVSSTHAHPNSYMGGGHINVNPPYEDSLFDDEFPPTNNLGGVRNNNANSGGGASNSMCLPNYEISEGSIIRTKDSVDLGARFINESDLGVNGREECLRLCCRTPYCNVAVFQEKSSGSCYMFDCGSTDDFRCKFTSQIQYMSAILRRKEIIQISSNSNNQQNVQPHSSNSNNNGGGNNQHETELSQLRGRGEDLEKGGKVLSNNGGGRSESNNNVAPTTSSLGPLDIASRRCSRWQFECKSSGGVRGVGECIAIYNACDGIPNCEDGSDEGPELHCPSSAIGAVPPPASHPPNLPQQSVAPSSSSTNSGHKSSGANNEGQIHNVQGTNANNPPATKDNNNHIFNHKDGGVMDQSYGTQLQQQKHLNPFMKPGYDYINGEQLPNSGYGGGGQNYLPNSQMSSANTYGGMQGGMGGGYGSGPYPSYNSGYPNQPSLAMNLPQFNGQPPNMNIPFQVPPILQQQQPYFGGSPSLGKGQQPLLQNPVFMPNANSAPIAVGGGKPGEMESGNLQRLQQPQSQTTMVPMSASATNSNQNPNSNTKEKSASQGEKTSIPVEGGGGGGSTLEAENRLEDEILKSLKHQPYNEAETAAVHLDSDEVSPHKAGPGAVFLFIVGLGMTIVMAVVVGCRLRRLSVGARRRRKNRLDPDYLVDGMYL